MPSKEAMEAALVECNHGQTNRICRNCLAAALDAYAAEQRLASLSEMVTALREVSSGRDAALAKLAAAEAEGNRVARLADSECDRRKAAEAEAKASRGDIRHLLQVRDNLEDHLEAAEERVRVLEAVLRHEIPWRDYKTKYGTVSIDANGAISIKAAAAGGGKDEPASAS